MLLVSGIFVKYRFTFAPVPYTVCDFLRTVFPHRDIHKYTWTWPGGRLTTRLITFC
jgi:hypothetical protein